MIKPISQDLGDTIKVIIVSCTPGLFCATPPTRGAPMSLVDFLSRTARGRIFLINLYEAFQAAPPHLVPSDFRKDVWEPVRRSLGAKATPGRALASVFSFLHDPANRGLRFARPRQPSAGGLFEVHSTTRPRDLIYDPNKTVVKFAETHARLGRRSENEPWTDRQVGIFCSSLKSPAFQNGSDYAETFDVFWATLDSSALSLDADTLRDYQGLVHIERDEAVIQLSFKCNSGAGARAARPRYCAGPTVVEATNHRRFKARPPHTRRTGASTAADLEKLRSSGMVHDGIEEVVLSAIPMAALGEVRFVGVTSQHPDVSGTRPSRRSIAHDDRFYAKVLEPTGGFAGVATALKAALE